MTRPGTRFDRRARQRVDRRRADAGVRAHCSRPSLIALGWYFWPSWLPWNWRCGGAGAPRPAPHQANHAGGSARRAEVAVALAAPPNGRPGDQDPAESPSSRPTNCRTCQPRCLLLTADELAAAGRYAEAVRERLRAIMRGPHRAGHPADSPGWTVTELADGAAQRAARHWRRRCAWPSTSSPRSGTACVRPDVDDDGHAGYAGAADEPVDADGSRPRHVGRPAAAGPCVAAPTLTATASTGRRGRGRGAGSGVAIPFARAARDLGDHRGRARGRGARPRRPGHAVPGRRPAPTDRAGSPICCATRGIRVDRVHLQRPGRDRPPPGRRHGLRAGPRLPRPDSSSTIAATSGAAPGRRGAARSHAPCSSPAYLICPVGDAMGDPRRSHPGLAASVARAGRAAAFCTTGT